MKMWLLNTRIIARRARRARRAWWHSRTKSLPDVLPCIFCPKALCAYGITASWAERGSGSGCQSCNDSWPCVFNRPILKKTPFCTVAPFAKRKHLSRSWLSWEEPRPRWIFAGPLLFPAETVGRGTCALTRTNYPKTTSFLLETSRKIKNQSENCSPHFILPLQYPHNKNQTVTNLTGSVQHRFHFMCFAQNETLVVRSSILLRGQPSVFDWIFTGLLWVIFNRYVLIILKLCIVRPVVWPSYNNL